MTPNSKGRTQSFLAFAQAISVAEGYGIAGAIPTVRNNPGDLKLSAGQITTFATPAEGWEALYHQLELMRDGTSRYYGPGMTLAEAGRIWTATEQSAWLANVIRAMRGQGFDVNETTTLGEILG